MQTFHNRASISIIFSFLAILILTNISFSQPARRHWERIEQIKKVKLLDILELDEETSTKFLAKYNEIERKIKEKSEELEQAIEKLNNRIQENAPSQELTKVTEQVLNIQKELQNLHLSKITEMKSILDEKRYAKFIVFENTFHKDLQRKVIEAMRKFPRDEFKPGKDKKGPGK